MPDINREILDLAKACYQASLSVAQLSTSQKNKVLNLMAVELVNREKFIIAENEKDISNAIESGLSEAMVDRLRLNRERLLSMANALREVAALNDPVGKMDSMQTRPNGIQVGMMHIPLGVIAMIYESRPNVTSDAAGLCLKSGNGVILRGGSEAFYSNHAIANALKAVLSQEGIPEEAITLMPTTDREAMLDLLKLDEYIDVVIPRGGEGLIRFVNEQSRIPVIKHYKGVCHLYVDKDADFDIALRLLVDGKASRPGVCNALETMLVHRDVANQFLPKAAEIMDRKNVEIRGCSQTKKIIPGVIEANEDDYYEEFLALKIAVRVVDNYDQAIDHIKKYGSDHTEVIATNNLQTSRKFVKNINSSVVLVNASSRFSDGGELGLGAEIGISTTKLHAYGPMGLEALTTKKFVVIGDGQTRHEVTLD